MNLTETTDLLSDLLGQVWRTYGKGYPITWTSPGASEDAGARAEATELELGKGKEGNLNRTQESLQRLALPLVWTAKPKAGCVHCTDENSGLVQIK